MLKASKNHSKAHGRSRSAAGAEKRSLTTSQGYLKTADSQTSNSNQATHPGLRVIKNESADDFSLLSVEGDVVYTGPKYLSNQIFLDVFDADGRHDRILENEESVELYENFQELKEKYLLVKIEKKEVPEKENLEKVKAVCFRFTDSPKGSSEAEATQDWMKPLSVQRHLHVKFK